MSDPVSPEALDKIKAYIDANLENYVASFIENMGSSQTDQELFDFMLEHMATYGLQVVPVYKESTGFAINRVWAATKREVLTVLGEGVSDPEAIDAAFKELPQGPDAPLELLDKMVDDGKLGLKSGEGFYRWENGQPQL